MAVLTHFFEKYILYVHVQHSAAKKNWLNFWFFGGPHNSKKTGDPIQKKYLKIIKHQ